MTKKLNKISPKALLNSKWTKVNIVNKEKHFVITEVKFNEEQEVVACVIEAVMTKNIYSINWRDLKIKEEWLIGWK
ncbi:MAG: TIGR02450 family Trp-rich protein [Thalassotalea sp.]|nr:TIGR02450 family Trp-rich protein [Thalassotalea sp.]